MSQENVELAQAWNEAWNAGDRIIERHISHGVGQGPAYEAEYTTIATVRKGKILYLEFFWDHSEALEAVGLSE
jgi:ketosteroid isomerase-like protein